MNLDKRTILLIVLSVFAFSGYNYYLQQQYPEYFAGQQTQPQETTPSPEKAQSPVIEQDEPATSPQKSTEAPLSYQRLDAEKLSFETETRRILFNQDFSAITSIQLKGYQQKQKSDQPVELLDSPLVIQGTTNIADRTGVKGFTAERDGQVIRFKRQHGSFLVVQEFTVPETGYGLPLKLSFTNTSDQSQDLTGGLLLQQNIFIPKSSGGFGPTAFVAQNKTFVYGVADSRHEEIAADYCEEPEGPVFSLRNERLDYIGFDSHYFLSVIEPATKLNIEMEKSSAESMDPYCPMSIMAYQRFGLIEPGKTVELEFESYFGPKDVDLLNDSNPALASTVKFGWFSVIAHPLLSAVKWIYEVLPNYGLAIIIVTLILKLLFYPLTKAAAISMKKMQKLQPEMNKLRERHKDDPQRMQRELMAFMARNKVNPAKGCLPILPQIPVFIAFYNVLSQAIELRHAPFYGWIQDLSAADPYYITPILLGVGMFIQQKLTPHPSLDKTQEKIMLMMPVIFTVMMLSLPAGMVLYMITNTVVSIFQQQWLNKRLAKQFG